MYEHIEDILVHDSKIAIKLKDPQWMDIAGNVVQDENLAFGCKVEIQVTRPDMAIVFDEAGCNTSQEYNNAKEGGKFITGVEDQAYVSCAKKHNHFTCPGVTTLEGLPLMCVIIISSKRAEIAIGEGIDWDQIDINETYSIHEGEEFEFLKKHKGKGKIFPGGPECNYKGTTIPALIAFTESGGINGTILTAIFKRLDDLVIYNADRRKWMIPFALVDSHQSRFDLDFLKYINDAATKWNVCICVPYGTALWQVGNSNQQNGCFKILLTQKKKEMYQKCLNTFQQNIHLTRTDIVPLVNVTWHQAFGDIEGNCKAMTERGWGPFNKNLLLHPLIRSNMTETMMANEARRGIFPRRVIKDNANSVQDINDNGNLSIN